MRKLLILICLTLIPFVSHAGTSLGILGGEHISNSVHDEKATAWAIQQTIYSTPVDYVMGYLNEGHEISHKRDGIYISVVIPHSLSGKVNSFFSVGPYVWNSTNVAANKTDYTDQHGVGVIFGLGLKSTPAQGWGWEVDWSRILTFKNADADVFLVGVNYNFGSSSQ